MTSEDMEWLLPSAVLVKRRKLSRILRWWANWNSAGLGGPILCGARWHRQLLSGTRGYWRLELLVAAGAWNLQLCICDLFHTFLSTWNSKFRSRVNLASWSCDPHMTPRLAILAPAGLYNPSQGHLDTWSSRLRSPDKLAPSELAVFSIFSLWLDQI